MITLTTEQQCPFYVNCPYNEQNSCQGATVGRPWTFTCEYVDQSGVFVENGQQRNELDKTGKMKVIMEYDHGRNKK